MNSLDRVVNDNKVGFYQNFNSIKTPLNDVLPYDVLPIIVSFLDERGMQAAAQVSKTFCAEVLKVVKPKELKLLQNYLTFLCENLPDNYANIGKYLADLLAGFNLCPNTVYVKKHWIQGYKERFLGAVTLNDVKSSLLDIRFQIRDWLRNLNLETLQTLEAKSKDIKKPEIFTNILYDAIIEDKIKSARGKQIYCEDLDLLFKELLKRGDLKNAIEVIYHMPSYDQMRAIRDISKPIVARGNVDKAIVLIQSLMDRPAIHSISAKDKPLYAICNKLLSQVALDLFSKGNIEKFLEIVEKIDLNGVEDNEMIVRAKKAILQRKQMEKIIAFLESYRWLFKPMWH